MFEASIKAVTSGMTGVFKILSIDVEKKRIGVADKLRGALDSRE